MDSRGHVALALSQHFREDDWRRANVWRLDRIDRARTAHGSSRKRPLLVLGAVIFMFAAIAPSTAASARTGNLHLTKECSAYTGQAGSFCTFVSSNIKAIPPGARIYYARAAGATSLDTDVVIVTRPGNVAAGHCTLDFLALPGVCTFSGGTGKFTHFHARASVSVDGTGVWHWDGTYSFSPRD